ncbi:MAG: polysaccharide biosynthesis/export family protein [Planctomycetota bacterium]
MGVCLTVLVGGCESTQPAIRGDAGAFSVANPSQGEFESPTTVGRDYRIGVPDRVTVTCDRVRGLSVREAVVDAEGYVAIPTLGRVKIAGLTADEASDALTRRVRTIDAGATMSLQVSRYASRHIYTFGGVQDAGPVAWRPGMTLADALAGSKLRNDADVREVSVIRPGIPGSAIDGPRRVTVDFARLLEQGDASVNVALRAGDVVVVPNADGAPVWSSWTKADQRYVAEVTTGSPASRVEESVSPVMPATTPALESRRVDWTWDTTSFDTVPVANRTTAQPLGNRDISATGSGYFGIGMETPAVAEPSRGVVFWN